MNTEYSVGNLRIRFESRARRRQLVLALYAGFAALDAGWFAFGGNNLFGLLLLVFFAYATRFLGGRTEPGGLLPSYGEGDERERMRRYRAHYTVYVWLDLLCFPALVATLWCISPGIRTASPAVQILASRLAWALLTAVGILYYTLPQAILLWTEPDMEQP